MNTKVTTSTDPISTIGITGLTALSPGAPAATNKASVMSAKLGGEISGDIHQRRVFAGAMTSASALFSVAGRRWACLYPVSVRLGSARPEAPRQALAYAGAAAYALALGDRSEAHVEACRVCYRSPLTFSYGLASRADLYPLLTPC